MTPMSHVHTTLLTQACPFFSGLTFDPGVSTPLQVYRKFGLPVVETPDAHVDLMLNGKYRLKDTYLKGINPFEKVG